MTADVDAIVRLASGHNPAQALNRGAPMTSLFTSSDDQRTYWRNGSGQPASSRIATSDGWQSIADIHVGQLLVTATGQLTRVRATRSAMGTIARVYFNDHTFILCSSTQLWSVQSSDRRSRGRPPRTLCLEAIAGSIENQVGQLRHYVVQPAPILNEERELPLHPYLVGALIGDGCISQRQAYFATADAEMVMRLRAIAPTGVFMQQRAQYSWHLATECCGRPNPVLGALRALDLLGHRAEHKFIPISYKLAGIEQRTGLLQGLMDTDGSASPTKPPSFTTVSSILAKDVQELVESLGGIARIAIRDGTVLPQYCLTMRLPLHIEPFALTRKRILYESKLLRPLRMTRAISGVEILGPEKLFHIFVESNDHAYLSDQFTVMTDATDAVRCAQSKFKTTANSCRHDVRRTALS